MQRFPSDGVDVLLVTFERHAELNARHGIPHTVRSRKFKRRTHKRTSNRQNTSITLTECRHPCCPKRSSCRLDTRRHIESSPCDRAACVAAFACSCPTRALCGRPNRCTNCCRRARTALTAPLRCDLCRGAKRRRSCVERSSVASSSSREHTTRARPHTPVKLAEHRDTART